MSDTLTTALERSAQPKEAKTILDLIERQKPQLERLLGSVAASERFARVATTELRRNGKLIECDPLSFLGALMLAAQLDLEPGPLGHVYLVPFKREVTFILGYKGMVALAYRSEQVKDVSAEIAYEGDPFKVVKGTTPKIVHEDAGPPAEREIVAAYAVAHLRTGGTVSRVVYPDEIAKAQARSANAKHPSSPWQTDYYAMVRKTAVRRLAPFLPQSPTFARGLEADEEPVDAVAVEEELDA